MSEMILSLFVFIEVWLFLPFALIAIIFAFVYNDSKSYGKSTFSMLISISLISWYFWQDIQVFLTENGLLISLAYFGAAYIIGAIVTAFIYWIFFNWKAKERFEQYLLETTISDKDWSMFPNKDDELKTLVLKHKVVFSTERLRNIFDDNNSELSLAYVVPQLGFASTKDEYRAAIAGILPPRFKVCKQFVIGAATSWPITLVWLLVSRVVKQLIERIISTFGKTFDHISSIAFGKF